MTKIGILQPNPYFVLFHLWSSDKNQILLLTPYWFCELANVIHLADPADQLLSGWKPSFPVKHFKLGSFQSKVPLADIRNIISLFIVRIRELSEKANVANVLTHKSHSWTFALLNSIYSDFLPMHEKFRQRCNGLE